MYRSLLCFYFLSLFKDLLMIYICNYVRNINVGACGFWKRVLEALELPGVTGICKLWCGSRELKSGFLQEWQVLSITHPCFQAAIFNFFFLIT